MIDRLSDSDLERTYGRLRRAARRLVRDPADADDVVQDAMERAWRFRERFASGAAAEPWLAAINRRAALDLLRRRDDALATIEDDDARSQDSTEGTVLRNEFAAAFDTALASLAPHYRDTIVLHDVLGFTSREIATREKLPYHTVRTHVFRARRALRERLARAVAA